MRPDGLDAGDVAAFLRANPGWLSEHPELYRVLHPPRRLHGEAMADHMAAMLTLERAHARAQSDVADTVLAAGRATAGLAARVEDAVLALLRATDPAECLLSELPALLGVDAVTLCAGDGRTQARSLPPGRAGEYLGTRDVVFRTAPSDAALLHGSAAALARVDALVRLDGDALLALAARDECQLHPEQGVRPLLFLGRAVVAAFGR